MKNWGNALYGEPSLTLRLACLIVWAREQWRRW